MVLDQARAERLDGGRRRPAHGEPSALDLEAVAHDRGLQPLLVPRRVADAVVGVVVAGVGQAAAGDDERHGADGERHGAANAMGHPGSSWWVVIAPTSPSAPAAKTKTQLTS